MPRLIRRDPLMKRIKDRLDPYDLLLQLAETLNDDTYDDFLKEWATPIGIGLNILFILAKLANKPSFARSRDDVFGDSDGRSGGGWFGWISALLVPLLTLFCCWNAVFTFLRQRHYRLFEQSVDEVPATPSARLVRVDSSPMSSSPLRYLQHVISDATKGSRPHADAEREVWEVSMWDPKPFHLTLFTLFSPGHLAVYYAMLPPTPLDPRPSLKVLMAFFFGVLLSLQLGFLKSSFSQQAKDSALVHGEVMNEYDQKFVRPSLNRPVRDVGIQTRESTLTPRGTKTREVDVYTPTTIVNRGFKTNPNPNYAHQYDPDNLSNPSESRRRRTSDFATPSSFATPRNAYAQTTNTTSSSRPSTAGSAVPDFSSPLKPHHERLRERSPLKAGDGGGGNLGIHQHAASPLRKTASSGQLPTRGGQQQQQQQGGGSPLKRMSTLDGGGRRRETTGRF